MEKDKLNKLANIHHKFTKLHDSTFTDVEVKDAISMYGELVSMLDTLGPEFRLAANEIRNIEHQFRDMKFHRSRDRKFRREFLTETSC